MDCSFYRKRNLSFRERNILVEKYFISRNLKYIDVESMSQSLHATYPDYRRRKLKSFTGQVEVAFKSLTTEMRSKNKSGKKAAQKKKQEEEEAPSTEQSAIEEINIEEDETSVKGPSMNSRLSSLYSGQNTVC